MKKKSYKQQPDAQPIDVTHLSETVTPHTNQLPPKTNCAGPVRQTNGTPLIRAKASQGIGHKALKTQIGWYSKKKSKHSLSKHS
jgi:hypothetical protein